MIASPPRRVVITGMGLICPLGNSPASLWRALVSAQSGIRGLQSLPDESLPTSIGAEAREFSGSIDEFGPLEKATKKAIRKNLKVMCRESQMAVASAQLALSDAEIEEPERLPERSGAVFGSDYMLTLPEEFNEGIAKCTTEGRFDFSQWGSTGLEQMQPLWMLKYLPNMPASHIAIFNDLRGPSNSITHREASSNLAVGEAYHTIARGTADRMLAGATGTRIHPMKAVHAAQTEQLAAGNGDPAGACRPFDAARGGMILGEGAATVVLEELETAQQRGATIYAEIVGSASSSVVGGNSRGRRDRALAAAMRFALRSADLSPKDVGHIHAHGLSTTSCDAEEARALVEIFGPPAEQPPLVAAKSNFGNLGAGSGLVELIASVLALREGQLFRLLNYDSPDPDCPVRPVTESGEPAGSSFLNLSVTPQGQAAVLAVRKLA